MLTGIWPENVLLPRPDHSKADSVVRKIVAPLIHPFVSLLRLRPKGRYSVVVPVDLRGEMTSPHMQSLAWIS